MPDWWSGLKHLYSGGEASAPSDARDYINPVTGDLMAPSDVSKQTKMLQGYGSGVLAPGQLMQPNPHPEGSEEWYQFEHDRQAGMAQTAPAVAMSMIGGGTPFAEVDALGMAGGRLPASARAPISGKYRTASQQPLTDAFLSGNQPVVAPNPQAALADAFASGNGWQTSAEIAAAQEAAARAPKRVNGRFANTRDYGRAQTLTPDGVTAPDVLQQATPLPAMGSPAPQPGGAVPGSLGAPSWDRGVPFGGQADPATINQNLSRIPNSFESPALTRARQMARQGLISDAELTRMVGGQ